MSSDGDFAGRTIVVTGGASGLGADVCGLLARRGARVAVLDLDGTGAQRIAGELPGDGHLAFALDVSDAAAVVAVFAEVAQQAGAIHGLVNNAGIRDLAGVLDLAPEEWDRIVAVNLSGSFYCSQAAARIMVQQGGGAIVNISSVGGLMAFPNRPGYSATKAGLIGLTNSFARDLGPRGVRVNAVCPGIIRSPLTESYFDDADFVRQLSHTIPLGQAGETHEVSEVTAFLLSDAASHVSGVALPVDGAFAASGTLAIVAVDSPFQQKREDG